jgi:hypothetical protein
MRALVQRVLSARVEASCVFTEDDRSHVVENYVTFWFLSELEKLCLICVKFFLSFNHTYPMRELGFRI